MTSTDTSRQPLTDQLLDEIAGRAAGLYEYATGLDDAWQDEADQLTGEDVPALLNEVRRLRAELERRTEDRTAAPDTLASWLHWRFGPHGQPWADVADEDKALWEHQARATRRAVERGGFKTAAPVAAVVSSAAATPGSAR